MQVLFIYGTLKRGCCRSAAMAGRFLGEAITRPNYVMVDLVEYPGLIEVTKDHGLSIQGELWEVDDICLEQLDKIEAVDEGLYERRNIELTGTEIMGEVQSYFYLGETKGLALCGENWIDREVDY